MMSKNQSSQIDRRISSLEKHLARENPILLKAVREFRELDKVAYPMGLLSHDDSFATRVPWWPLIAFLGTFSSGKSSFINSHLRIKLQRTGNQAVDDKFTVICYSQEPGVHTLPGLALDADPRFPFYQISRDIEHVATGEGRRVDAYLQLKTCDAEKVRSKIFIDSPGFDADAQRNSTLRITDHIMDLSDLVLVFFDARHPEPGAMKDTLDHLVAKTIHRPDSNKFLFVLNQIDCTVKEDNLEDVTAAWQRSLAQSGLTAGRFYQIYNRDAASPIDNPDLRKRYESKCNEDLNAILERFDRVEVERAYRVVSVLEHTAHSIQDILVPRIRALLERWKKWTLILDGGWLVLALAGWGMLEMGMGLPVSALFGWGGVIGQGIMSGAAVVLALYIHFAMRRIVANRIVARLPKEEPNPDLRDSLVRAFRKNTRPWMTIFSSRPIGWNFLAKRRVREVIRETDGFVQELNDQFTNPSGDMNEPDTTAQATPPAASSASMPGGTPPPAASSASMPGTPPSSAGTLAPPSPPTAG